MGLTFDMQSDLTLEGRIEIEVLPPPRVKDWSAEHITITEYYF